MNLEISRLLAGKGAEWWTAVGTVVNAVVVIFLAAINYLYMRITKRQADDTSALAAAAEQQTTASIRNIHLIERQIQDQEILKSIEAQIDLRRLQSDLNWWLTKIDQTWNQLPPFEGLLPKNWPSIVFIVERSLPDRKEDLRNVETWVRNAETLIRTELARPSVSRREDVIRAAYNDLAGVRRPLGEMLTALQNLGRHA